LARRGHFGSAIAIKEVKETKTLSDTRIDRRTPHQKLSPNVQIQTVAQQAIPGRTTTKQITKNKTHETSDGTELVSKCERS